MISAENLKKLFHYCPETGKFTRLEAVPRWKGQPVGTQRNDGAVIIQVSGVFYRAHRLAWLYMTGEWPIEEIDHINHDRSDNRWVNLRVATRLQNEWNKPHRKDNVAGYKGVGWRKDKHKWRARIRVNKSEISLGYYSNPKDAALAYDQAAVKYFGEFACTNATLGLI